MAKDVYRLEIVEKNGTKHCYLFDSLVRMRFFWHNTLKGYQQLTLPYYKNIDFCWTYKNGQYHSFRGF